MTNKNTETAISVLLTPHGVTIEDLESAFAELSGKHIDFADFYFQRTVSEGYVLEEGIIKNGSFNTDMGVGVRAVSGEKSALAYSDEISKDALIEAVRTVRAIGNFSDDKTVVKLEKGEFLKLFYQPVNPIELKETKDKIEIIKKLDKLARKLSPHIIQVMCTISSVYEVILIAKRDGALAGDIRPLVRANLSVVVQKDGKTERGQCRRRRALRLITSQTKKLLPPMQKKPFLPLFETWKPFLFPQACFPSFSAPVGRESSSTRP